jgi:hypothetical protein
MKKYMSALAAIAALAIASSATAQTITIRITGATAFRKAANNSIKNILNPGYTYGFAGTSLDSAGKAQFQGTTIVGNIPVDIKLLWIGSAGGIQCLAQDINQSGWLAATNLTSGSGTSGLSGPTDSGVADAAFSDAFQGSTLFTTPQLTDNILGVIAFQWTRNVNAAAAGISNMTPLQAQALLAAGIMPLSQLDGNSANQGIIAYVTGRDPDSGTRVTTFAETAFGVFTPPVQYEMLGTSGTNGSVTSIRPWPAATVLGIPYPEGQSGYASGGTMAGWMNTPNPDVFLGYMSTDDAAKLPANQRLTWNGVPYSADAIRQGLYTFWSYEHLLWRTSLSGSKLTFLTQLTTRLHDVDAALSGVLLSTMAVGRSVEGGAVTFGSPY